MEKGLALKKRTENAQMTSQLRQKFSASQAVHGH